MSPPSKKDSDIRADVMKLPDKYGDYIFDWIPALETDAATNCYDQYLGEVLQVVPAHPVPGHGLTNKQYSELLTLIQLLNKTKNQPSSRHQFLTNHIIQIIPNHFAQTSFG